MKLKMSVTEFYFSVYVHFRPIFFLPWLFLVPVKPRSILSLPRYLHRLRWVFELMLSREALPEPDRPKITGSICRTQVAASIWKHAWGCITRATAWATTSRATGINFTSFRTSYWVTHKSPLYLTRKWPWFDPSSIVEFLNGLRKMRFLKKIQKVNSD